MSRGRGAVGHGFHVYSLKILRFVVSTHYGRDKEVQQGCARFLVYTFESCPSKGAAAIVIDGEDPAPTEKTLNRFSIPFVLRFFIRLFLSWYADCAKINLTQTGLPPGRAT